MTEVQIETDFTWGKRAFGGDHSATSKVIDVVLSGSDSWSPRWTATVKVAGAVNFNVDRNMTKFVGLRLRRLAGRGVPLSAWTSRIGGRVSAFTPNHASPGKITDTIDGTRSAGKPQEQRLTLYVDSVTEDYVEGTSTFSLTGAEMLLHDSKRMLLSKEVLPFRSSPTPAIQTLIQSVSDQVADAGGTRLVEWPLVFDAEGDIDADDLVWEPGESVWSMIEPLLSLFNLILYADHPTEFRLVERRIFIPSAVTFTMQDLIRAEYEVRPRLAEASLIYRYRSRETGEVALRGYGTQGIVLGSTRDIEMTAPIGFVPPLARWVMTAAQRGSRETETFTFTTAISFDVQPDAAVTIRKPSISNAQNPAGPSTYTQVINGRVQEVTYRTSEGLMDVTLYELITTWE